MILFGQKVGESPIVVAEVGVNHEGDVSAAARILELVARSGAHAVKLQSYTAARYASASDPERLARVGRFALDQAAHLRLKTVARDCGIELFSTALTEDWVPFLAENFSAIKIASGDLDFEPVIRAAARAGKPILLSTGCGTVEEIDRAVNWVRSEINSMPLNERLVLLHCVSAYPTPIEEANLLSVPFLAERYGAAVGYSNHVIGPEAALAAVALGASIVELHVTDRREGRTFRDHALSFEPGELAEFVQAAQRVFRARGVYGKQPAPSEVANRQIIRKGVVAARDLPAGTVLQDSDLMYARPASEFASGDRPTLVGRRLKLAARAGETIMRAALT